MLQMRPDFHLKAAQQRCYITCFTQSLGKTAVLAGACLGLCLHVGRPGDSKGAVSLRQLIYAV